MGDHERSAPEPAHPTPAGGELSERRIKRRQAIRMLELDALAIEVISTLAACGVQSILLKGPVLARALYDDGAPRPYRDCDILVPEGRLADAGAALLAAGFACDFDERDAHALLDPHAQYWTRPPSRLIVDLHWTFDGVRAEPEVLWSDFAHGSAVMQFHNTAVRTPARSRIALLVALHAARHGREIAKPLEDLRRALERFESGVWRRPAGWRPASGPSMRSSPACPLWRRATHSRRLSGSAPTPAPSCRSACSKRPGALERSPACSTPMGLAVGHVP